MSTATYLRTNYCSAAIVVSCLELAYEFKAQHFDPIQIDEANEILHRIESTKLGDVELQSLAAPKKHLSTTWAGNNLYFYYEWMDA